MLQMYLELCLHLRLSAPVQKTNEYKLQRRMPAVVIKRMTDGHKLHYTESITSMGLQF
jgi:hypothetical protein